LIAPTLLSTERTYFYNSNNATSAFEEENLLREEMQRDLVQQLIRRYRAIKPSTQATETE
jgi:outer membrane lipopolysaccharide assembly protein LptE/RlpB